MSERTDYSQVAAKLNYATLEKKLEELREEKPPQKRKRAADVLAPVREKLAELHAKGWTYAQLAEELKSAGLPVAVGTLRAYLGGGHRGKSKARRRGGKRRAAAASAAQSSKSSA